MDQNSLLLVNCIDDFIRKNRQSIHEIRNREFCFLACGSTKLGLEVGIDMCHENILVYDDPSLIPNNQLVIGLTFSGNSTEVADFFSEENRDAHWLITSSNQPKGNHVLKFEKGETSNRLLPLLAAGLAMTMMGFSFKDAFEGLNKPQDETVLVDQLMAGYGSIKTPLFVSDRNSWFARIFTEQHMEFLKKPAFALHFPHFTHNLIWSLGSSDSEKYHFWWLESATKYSDARNAKTKNHLSGLGFSIDKVDSKWQKATSLDMLTFCLGVFENVSTKLAIQANHEHSFKSE